MRIAEQMQIIIPIRELGREHRKKGEKRRKNDQNAGTKHAREFNVEGTICECVIRNS